MSLVNYLNAYSSKIFIDILNHLNNIFIIYKHEGCNACRIVGSILNKLGYKYKKKLRNNISKKDFNKDMLVIVIGGDGTTLKACSFIDDGSIVFSVNSYPRLTEGFLTRANVINFRLRFLKLVRGEARIRQLPRIEAKINEKSLSTLALNEVSISSPKPYLTMIYEMSKNIEKASGIIISTAIGSTAWMHSAGGKKMPISSRKLQYIIREPYNGRIYKVKKPNSIVDQFKVKALCEGIIVFDGSSIEYHFKKNDHILVQRSQNTLNFVDF